MNPWQLIKPYFRKEKYVITIGLIALILVDVSQLIIPRILKYAVDDLTALRADAVLLLRYALYILGLAIFAALLRFVWRQCLLGVSRRIEEGLRNRLFDHIQSLSPSFFDQTRTGDIMARATNDLNNVRMASGMGMVALTDVVILGISAIAFMFYMNAQLTAYVIAPMPFIALFTRFFSKKMHQLYLEVQEEFSGVTESVRERFSGIRIVKAFTLEKKTIADIENVSRRFVNKNLFLLKIIGIFFPLMVFFSNISLLILIYFGGKNTIFNEITAGDFVAFTGYLSLLTWPMMALGWVTNLIQRGKASLNRIGQILSTEPEIKDPPRFVPVKTIEGRIVFDGVSFSYDPNEKQPAKTLSDINFTLEPGKMLGIVGPPGSGKTTLLKLIPRLYDVVSGRIIIDDIPVHAFQLKDLRSRIAYIPQEPFLFSGSIAENITLGNPQASAERIDRAVKSASLFEDVESFPRGLETPVGEKGVILSGGQKQRVALARGFLTNAPILLLDDPISQVDMKTGNDIIETIRSLFRKKTVIIVSHRLSATQFADLILVLKNGRIVDAGNHERLMLTNDYYSDTYQMQEAEKELHARIQ